MGLWGYNISEGFSGILYAILLPLAFASPWGIFAVPRDPSRSGKTVIATPGHYRLVLELFLFAVATWMLFDLEYEKARLDIRSHCTYSLHPVLRPGSLASEAEVKIFTNFAVNLMLTLIWSVCRVARRWSAKPVTAVRTELPKERAHRTK